MALSEKDKEEIQQIIRQEIHDSFVEAFANILDKSKDESQQQIVLSILQYGKSKLSERLTK